MSKLRLEIDNYKEFFLGEHGLALITQIIESDDYNNTKDIAEWEGCPSKVLDKIATKYMVVCEEDWKTKKCLAMLEEIAENSKVSIKTLEKIMEFAVSLFDEQRHYVCEVLEEVAESKKLTADIAKRLYEVAVEHNLNEVIKELGENKNTPDDILFDIVDNIDADSAMYEAASEEIIRRYRKIKEASAEQEG